ncbi:MAG TPA: serine protease, partial [Thermoleophilaceae bacterium]|nr:serine protease [Thermoleophilaceae bacterium]
MLRLPFLALAALTLVCALAPAARAGDVKPRIVGGVDAGSIPYQVAVFNGGGFCGGVIFDASTVITAAHCVVDLGSTNLSPVPDVQVVAGTSNLASLGTDGVVEDAKTLSVDPQYDPTTNDHDIAKIELASPLWTGSPPPAIQPIGIVNDTSFDTALSTGVTATVTGWGCTSPEVTGADTCSTTLPDALQTVDIPLIDQTTCTNDYSPVGVTITPNMFCAGVAGADVSTNKDSCFGDSGGPLTIDDPSNPGHPVLAGLVDSGNGCAQDTFPGIYTRVS